MAIKETLYKIKTAKYNEGKKMIRYVNFIVLLMNNLFHLKKSYV